MTDSPNTSVATLELRGRLVGRCFVGPLFDYLLIGGGLSLAVTLLVAGNPAGAGVVSLTTLPYFVLISNSAHFAASTVRLYAKPDAYSSWPLLTMAFPLIALVLLTLSMLYAGRIGPHLQSLYLTWSPYHYAAQAYGLAAMYCYRSGCRLSRSEQRWLYWTALLPFFYNFVTAPGVGLRWLLPERFFAFAVVQDTLLVLHYTLIVLAFVMPTLLFVKLWRGMSGPMPLISLLTVVTNGIWFFVLAPLDAFVYATIFHGVQYLAIVIIFHVKEQLARPDNSHGVGYHVMWFYGASLILGYALFNCLPLAYVFAGFGQVESVLLVVAAINIHHFIVDAYIWRLRKDKSNRRVVESGVPVTA